MSFFSNLTSVFSSIGDQLLPIKSESDIPYRLTFSILLLFSQLFRIILIGAKNTGKSTLIAKNAKLPTNITNNTCNYMELNIKLILNNERKLVTLQLV